MAGLSPIAFQIARFTANYRQLKRLSIGRTQLLAPLAGKSVALVGNARALSDHMQGAQIDAADLVIRINRAPMPSPESHGTRTDWLALATSLSQAEEERIGAERILWMSHKPKRLNWRIATSRGFYLHPRDEWVALKKVLGAAPSTGAMVLALLRASEASEIRLFGFDFFASTSLSGRREAKDVPHDFAAEGQWVKSQLAQDLRIHLTPL